jgi:Fic family protein
VDTEQGDSWTQYSGKYRQVDVVAGLHQFPDHDLVPRMMRKMIADVAKDMEEAAKAGEIDPIAFAAKYCHVFVNIHPFLDGNGRICRLILNALLLKYGGFLVCIGQDSEDRDKYLGIAAESSMAEQAPQVDDYDDGTPAPKAFKTLASYTLKHVTKSMRGFVQSVRGELDLLISNSQRPNT